MGWIWINDFWFNKGGQSWDVTRVPTNLTVELNETAGYDLSWTSGTTNQEGFEVYVSVDGGEYILVDTTASTSYTDTTSDGSILVWKVRAYHRSHYTNFSNTTTWSWFDYWPAQTDLLLYFGQISNISSGKLYNEMNGASDYLTVGGSEGSYTFQAPNNATYKTADTDYIWFKTDETQRTTTEAELVGYDLPRTPVKYDDNSPYSIRWIGILKSGVTLTASQLNKLFESFDLPIEWNNDTNAFGHIKGNRLGQTLWTPEPVYYAYDTFTDTNGTLLTNHTMDVGSGWVNGAGVWTISGNKATEAGQNSGVWITTDCGQCDFDFSFKLDLSSDAYYTLGAMFRYQDISNNWVVIITNTADSVTFDVNGNGGGSNNSVSITKYIGQATIRILCSGNSIKAYFNGVLKHDITNSHMNNQTKCGLTLYSTGARNPSTYDDFKITSI